MTKDEINDLMENISTAYPVIMQSRNMDLLVNLWTDCLRDADAAAVNRAFVRYYQEDVRNLPPTPGNLLELVTEELPDLQWEE